MFFLNQEFLVNYRIPLLFLCFTACSPDRLHVYNEYLSLDDLASMKVDTPDARKEFPTLGQRIRVSWTLASSLLADDPDAEIVLKVRYGDRLDEVIRHKVEKMKGMFTHSLVGDEYFDRGGITAYKAELIVEGELVDEWQHQLWARVIRIGEQ
jgi:hypothetical protein